MGKKNKNGYQLDFGTVGIKTGTMTGTATITTNPQNINTYDTLAVAVNWTGTATGTITLQMSADGIQYDNLVFTPVLTQPSGSGGQFSSAIPCFGFQYFRATYTNVSGTGVLKVFVYSKDYSG